jgi:hypothetical protein
MPEQLEKRTAFSLLAVTTVAFGLLAGTAVAFG